MREDREVDDTQRHVVTGDGRLRLDEVLSDTGGHHHAAGAQSDPDGFVQRRQQFCEAGLPADLGMPISRRGNAQGAGVGDRFAREIDQRLLDARILDACLLGRASSANTRS
jgi:hypothetical protein